jgi:putative acetyltransferase
VQQELTLRHEHPDDILGIRNLVSEAFGRPGEADLIDALREAGALSLSAVALLGGRLAGHVAFSPISIGGAHRALALAPAAVAPQHQRQGIGTALIRWSLAECQKQQGHIVVVLGEPGYYRRFGFTSASAYGISCPFPVPDEAYMVLELQPGAMQGVRGLVQYRAEFGAL